MSNETSVGRLKAKFILDKKFKRDDVRPFVMHMVTPVSIETVSGNAVEIFHAKHLEIGEVIDQERLFQQITNAFRDFGYTVIESFALPND